MFVDLAEENVLRLLARRTPHLRVSCRSGSAEQLLQARACTPGADSGAATARTRLILNIHDDGRGFDAIRVRGLGLLGMSERVAHLNGTLKIESEEGRGTALRIELPLDGQPYARTRSRSRSRLKNER
jgi:two-component sensor histidine kinase